MPEYVNTETGEVVTADEAMDETARQLIEEALGLPSPRRVVTVVFECEDLRALLARPLLFVATGKFAPESLQHIHIEVTQDWAVAAAADGFALGVQKMRCESDDSGILLLADYDAARILRLLPKPSTKTALGPVTIEFEAGGAHDDRRELRLTYEQFDRKVSYTCLLQASSFPNYRTLLELDGDAETSRTALQPAFVERVAKAAMVAKDQAPVVMRWYLVKSHPGDANPAAVARFTTTAFNHDEFVAVLMPLFTTWHPDDELPAVGERMRDMFAESEPLRPVNASLDLGGSD